MTACQGFLLGLLAARIPSLTFLGCIALGSAPKGRTQQTDIRANPRQQNA